MASLIAVTDIPTVALLYRSRQLRAPSAVSNPTTPNQSYNNKIGLITVDITKLKVDAVVNAANESLLGGGGVDGAIHRAAGRRLVKECETLHGCDTGSAKITDAYNLPCKKVIHAVGPVYSTTKRVGKHTELLRGCYRKSLELAVQNQCTSIAFSALSTGVYGYPSNEAAQTAIEEVKRFLDGGKGDGLEKIVFCNFMEKDEDAYERYLPDFFPPTDEDLGRKKSSEDNGASLSEQSAPEEKRQKTDTDTPSAL